MSHAVLDGTLPTSGSASSSPRAPWGSATSPRSSALSSPPAPTPWSPPPIRTPAPASSTKRHGHADIEDRFEVQIPQEMLSSISTVDDVVKALTKLSEKKTS